MTPDHSNKNSELMEASLSMVIMSIASSAAMSMGLTPTPEGKIELDKTMARFNIDLLNVLKIKTQNNLTPDEKGLLDHILQDLQNKFIQIK
jgi:Domain of unknown function (DUF1844)